MQKRNYLQSLLIFAGLLIFISTGCNKKDDNDTNNGSTKTVKYEITGNYTGKFTVLINDNASGSQTYSNVTIPWSKEVTYPKEVIAIGMGAGNTGYGSPGQTAMLKIHVNGNVVKQSNATAGSGGEITLPALAHSF